MHKMVEVKKIQRSLQVRIPTNDDQVKYRLRVLKAPICFFGENAAARRDRLKIIMTTMVANGETIPTFKDVAAPQFQGDINQLKRKAFWSAGDKESADLRKAARLKLLQESLRRAAVRIDAERERRTMGRFNCNQKIDRMERQIKTFVPQVSIPAADRPLTLVKFNHDGNKLATGDRSGFVKLWDVSGSLLHSFRTHQDRIADLVLHPLSEDQPVNLISGGADMDIHLWSGSGEKVDTLPRKHTNRIAKMLWHPHGDLLLSTSFDKSWITWDIETKQCISSQPGHDAACYAIACHPDGSLCATSDLSGHIRMWDLRKGQHIWGMKQHIKQVLTLDFSPKGYLFASGSDDNTVTLWDLRKREIPYSIAAHNKSITCVKFAPNHGNYIMSTSKDRTVKFWNGKRYGLIQTVYGHEDAISGADISPNGMLVATASFDRTFKLWGPEDIVIDTER